MNDDGIAQRYPATNRSLGELGLEQLEILGFPPHGVVDTAATTRVIIENPFFNRAGAHLAVFTEVDGATGRRGTADLGAAAQVEQTRATACETAL